MSATVVIPVGNYSNGTTPFSAVVVPDGTTLISLTLDRALWSGTTVQVTFQIEISRDGGTTWSLLAKATATGGSVLAPGGGTATVSGVTVKLNPATVGVQVRGSLTVSNGTIHTSGTLTLQ